MRENNNISIVKYYKYQLLVIILLLPLTVLRAQLNPKVEKAMDEYYTEITNVYKIIDTEEVDVALLKIDNLKPSIEKKAKILADLANNDPELLEFLDSESFIMDFQDKPYFMELMRIIQSESFGKKFMSSNELQSKVEEIENLIEAYTDSGDGSQEEKSELDSGVAFSISLNGSGKYSGTYNIVADFEEGAVAYIDDLDYLRIDITGESNGQEALVSFFVNNTGTGRQEWETEGHFVFEMMDTEGELLMSLWGSEDMGYFDITSVDKPGGFVTGKLAGKCEDGNGESEKNIPVTGNFKVRYLEMDY